MIIKEFIESGILSMYVLGAATQEEQQEVERMSELYPEIKAELLELQSAIDNYAYQFDVPPAPHLKDEIIQKIFSTENIFKNELTENQGNSQKNNQEKPYFFWESYKAAAGFIFLALSLLANIYFYSQWQTSENQIVSIKRENQTMASEVKVIENTNNIIVTIKGAEDLAPALEAWVYWDKTTHETHIFCPTLPTPPTGKQYQLWAIDGNNVVDAGVFDLKGLQKVKKVDKFQKFVVTLERTGGVPKAEGKIYASGGV